MDDYASWLARPLTVYFAGGFVKSGAGAFVRLGLSSLNVPGRGAAGDVRVHCAGRSKAAAASTTPWLAAARSGVAGVAPPAYVHGMQWEGYFDAYLADLHRLHWRPMARDTAHGRHCLPPLTAEEDVRNMEQAKFCLCPRGDSPSSSRIYAAVRAVLNPEPSPRPPFLLEPRPSSPARSHWAASRSSSRTNGMRWPRPLAAA